MIEKAIDNTIIAFAALGVVTWFGWAIEGCGASAATHSAYSIEAARCIANERVIIERTGTTEEQDRADMAAERARCDHELSLIVGGAP
jgi:hypothetical protein